MFPLKADRKKSPVPSPNSVPRVMPGFGGGVGRTNPATTGTGTGPRAHRQSRQKTTTSIPPLLIYPRELPPVPKNLRADNFLPLLKKLLLISPFF